MLPIEGFKYLLCGFIVTMGLLGTSILAWSEEKATGVRGSLKEGAGRSPFSLPPGVKFLKEEEDAEAEALSISTKWEEGMVASRVDGIFQRGEKTTAIINGVLVDEGSWAGKEQVVKIEDDKVVLAGKEGEERVLPFKRGELDLKVVKRVKSKDKEKK
ncbi:MAG: hypothetical protein ACE5IC_02305 [Candidatus Brocadiales bacterium]